MTANVPMMEKGSARLGITVAETLRRNRKMTAITRPSVISMVNWTSVIGFADGVGAVVENVHVHRRRQLRAKNGSRRLMLSVTSMVLVPGWRWIARMMAR